MKKPRWLLAHDHVVFARKLLNDLGFSGDGRGRLKLKAKASSISDLRVIDAYEDAIPQGEPFQERKGNWVQKFQSDEDTFLFATAQFSRYQEVEAFIREKLSDTSKIESMTKPKGERRE